MSLITSDYYCNLVGWDVLLSYFSLRKIIHNYILSDKDEKNKQTMDLLEHVSVFHMLLFSFWSSLFPADRRANGQ